MGLVHVRYANLIQNRDWLVSMVDTPFNVACLYTVAKIKVTTIQDKMPSFACMATIVHQSKSLEVRPDNSNWRRVEEHILDGELCDLLAELGYGISERFTGSDNEFIFQNVIPKIGDASVWCEPDTTKSEAIIAEFDNPF